VENQPIHDQGGFERRYRGCSEIRTSEQAFHSHTTYDEEQCELCYSQHRKPPNMWSRPQPPGGFCNLQKVFHYRLGVNEVLLQIMGGHGSSLQELIN
jgi:hypothetical protein